MEAGAAAGAEQKTERPAVIVPPSSAPPGGAAAQKSRTGRRGSISSAQSGSRGGSHRGSVAQKGAAGPGKYGRTGPGARGGPGGERADGENPGGDENDADEWESVQTKNTVQRVGLNLLNEQKRRRPEDISYERPPIKYEPSYQLKPDSDHRFSSVKVRTALNELIAKYVEQESDTYSQRAARRISVGLSELVKERVKSLGFSRYKLVVEVFVGELKLGASEFLVGSRMVADPEVDQFVLVEHRSVRRGLWVSVVVFGVYIE